MNKTKIEYCDYTWNVVTGCYHDCNYCYARKIAERFGGNDKAENCGICGDCPKDTCLKCTEYVQISKIHELDFPKRVFYPRKQNLPYPYSFEPTFYKYKLDEPKKLKKPSTIFVSSMGDLFGSWVPTYWIKSILDVIEQCPQHTFIFLTKNPRGYSDISIYDKLRKLKNVWIGTTITSGKDIAKHGEMPIIPQKFLSIEPLQEPLYITYLYGYDWVIIGSETGNRKNKVIPKKEWIDSIIKQCRMFDIPVFMKDSLIPIVGKRNMLREFPEGLKR